MSIAERKQELAAKVGSLISAVGISQSELARRMQDRGWNYSQMTVSRTLAVERTIGALEYQDLLTALGVVRVLESAEVIELAELRAFRARIMSAVGAGLAGEHDTPLRLEGQSEDPDFATIALRNATHE